MLSLFAIAGFSCSEAGPSISNTDSQSATGGMSGTKGGTESAAGMQAAGASGMAGAGSGGSAGKPMVMTIPEDDGQPTFSGIYTFEFRSCRVDVCHGKGIAGLDMTTKDQAYRTLFDQPASPMGMCEKLGKKRVVAGDPDNSLMYLKLDTVKAPCGQQMPPGGQLSQKARDRIRAWIEMGAKND